MLIKKFLSWQTAGFAGVGGINYTPDKANRVIMLWPLMSKIERVIEFDFDHVYFTTNIFNAFGNHLPREMMEFIGA